MNVGRAITAALQEQQYRDFARIPIGWLIERYGGQVPHRMLMADPVWTDAYREWWATL